MPNESKVSIENIWNFRLFVTLTSVIRAFQGKYQFFTILFMSNKIINAVPSFPHVIHIFLKIAVVKISFTETAKCHNLVSVQFVSIFVSIIEQFIFNFNRFP